MWEMHCQGIRHRRQVLSLRHTGARGTVLVSEFESLPGEAMARHTALHELMQGWSSSWEAW